MELEETSRGSIDMSISSDSIPELVTASPVESPLILFDPAISELIELLFDLGIRACIKENITIDTDNYAYSQNFYTVISKQPMLKIVYLSFIMKNINSKQLVPFFLLMIGFTHNEAGFKKRGQHIDGFIRQKIDLVPTEEQERYPLNGGKRNRKSRKNKRNCRKSRKNKRNCRK